MRQVLVFAMLFLSSANSFGGIFSPKPWCEHRLQSDPRELKAFLQDLGEIRGYKTNKTEFLENGPYWIGKVNINYGEKVVKKLSELLLQPRYQNLEPEMKSKLISYFLVKVIRITRPRDHSIQPISRWLHEFLSAEQGFSRADLERMHLSYRMLLSRNSRWIDRPHRVGAEIIGLAIDYGISAGIDAMWTSLSSTLIPGAGFIFFPAVFLGRRIYLQMEHSLGLDPLNELTLKWVADVEQKFSQLIISKMTAAEIGEQWQQNFSALLNKAGTEINSGSIKAMVENSCAWLENWHGQHPEQSADGMVAMIKPLELVNPIDSAVVREAFARIKKSVITLKIIDPFEIAKIQEAMRAVAKTWVSNEAAQKSIEDLLKTGWIPQPLPE